MIKQCGYLARGPTKVLSSSTCTLQRPSRWPALKPWFGSCSDFSPLNLLCTNIYSSSNQRVLDGHSDLLNRRQLASLFICNSKKTSVSAESVTLYFDGGSRFTMKCMHYSSSVFYRGNPGPGGSGSTLEDPNGRQIWRGCSFLGTVTNNQAEYDGLIKGLLAAKEAGVKNLKVYGDSKLVIEQMQGNWAVKSPKLRPLHAQATELVRCFDSITFNFVKRDENSIADALVNDAIDWESGQSEWAL
eukprot:g2668.t1